MIGEPGRRNKMNIQLEKIAKIWPGIQNIFSVPHNQKEYNRLVHILDGVIDEVGENESHPLASLMETLGSLIESYEVQNIPEIDGSPSDAFKTLMEEHDLKQSDFPEIGSQGVISEMLSGKRQFNVRQIKLLSNRFDVSPAVFM
jgi:HTH-type transcriptional regulator/antitoxin HigA